MWETYVCDRFVSFDFILTCRDRSTTPRPRKRFNSTSSRAGPLTGSPSFVTNSQVTPKGAFLNPHAPCCVVECRSGLAGMRTSSLRNPISSTQPLQWTIPSFGDVSSRSVQVFEGKYCFYEVSTGHGKTDKHSWFQCTWTRTRWIPWRISWGVQRRFIRI